MQQRQIIRRNRFKDYKVWQSWITNCDSFWIIKCDKNFKNWITKCDVFKKCDGLQSDTVHQAYIKKR